MRLTFLVLFSLVSLLAGAQPAYEWARLLGGVAGNAWGEGTVRDASGNIILKGGFEGSLKIGSTYYRSSYYSDTFIAKYDVDGNLLWFKQIGFDRVEDNSGFGSKGRIATDGAGNIYIAGIFYGAGNIDGELVSSNGIASDMYVIKYDNNGNLQWIKTLGGTGYEDVHALEVDNGGEVYVGGDTRSLAFDFNGNPVNTGPLIGAQQTAFFFKLNPDGTDAWINIKNTAAVNVTAALYSDGSYLFVGGRVSGKAFLGRYNTFDGATVWETTDGTTPAVTAPAHPDHVSTVNSLQGYGSTLYAAGDFSHTSLQFGSLLPMTNQEPTGGTKDMFMVRYNLSGVPQFSVSYGSSNPDVIEDQSFVEYDGDYFLAVTGYYGGALAMGTANLPALGDPSSIRNAFLAVFDVEFGGYDNPRVTTLPSTGASKGFGVTAFLNSSSAYTFLVTGEYEGALTINGEATNQTQYSFFLSQYDFSLTETFSHYSSTGQLTATHLKVGDDGHVYLAGNFEGMVDLYGHPLLSTETSSGTIIRRDLFVAKMEPDGSVVWVTTAAAIDNDTMLDLTVDGNGSVYFLAHFYLNPTVAGVTLSPVETERVIVKLDNDGNFEYFIYADDMGVGTSVSAIEGWADGDGLFVSGSFDGTFDFQGYTTGAVGAEDIFLMKLDASGAIGSASDIRFFGGAGSDIVTDMHQESGKNLVMTGYTNDDITFDGFPLTIQDGVDLFVVSLNGTLVAATPTFLDGGADDQLSYLVTYDPSGNISVAGTYNDGGGFGERTPGDGKPFFLANYNATGARQWFRLITQSVEAESDIGGIAADDFGNIYMGGTLDGTLDFNTATLDDTGESDAWVVQYDLAGDLKYALAFGGDYSPGEESEGYEKGFALDVCPDNEIWFTGTLVARQAAFGPITLKPYGRDISNPEVDYGMDSYVLNIDFLNAPVELQKVYWTEEQDNKINRSDLDGTNFEHFYTGFSITPQGIAYDSDNNQIFWTDTNGKVRYGLVGPTGFTNGPNYDLINESTSSQRDNFGIALDVPNGNIYWVSAWDGSIKVANFEAPVPQSTIQQVVTGLIGPSGVAYDPTSQKLYYTEVNGTGSNNEAQIHSYHIPTDTDVIEYSRPATINEKIQFNDVKLDLVEGTIYWSMTETREVGSDDNIFYADLANISGTFNDFPTRGVTIGIDVDPHGGKVYWVDKLGTVSRISRADLDGSNQEILHQGSIDNIFDPNFITLQVSPAVPGCTNPPTANAGPAQTVCQNSSVNLAGAITYASPTWSTSGDGTFNNNLIPGPVYTPGASDISTGTVTLTLTAEDPDESGPCVAATSQVVITIDPSATASAGADMVICPTANAVLSGAIGGTAAGILWTSAGDGSFADSSLPATTYTPGSADIAAGTVALTLNGTGVGVCPNVSDALTVTILQPVIAADLSINASVSQTSLVNVISASTIGTGDIIQVTILQAGTKGSTTVRTDSQIDYTPSTGTIGPDVILYRICNQCSFCDDGQINITILNETPVFTPPITPPAAEVGSTATVNLASLLTDANSNLDLSTLAIVGVALSGATVTIDASFNLVVDYSTVSFVGTDQITLRVFDSSGASLEFIITIEVTGEIQVFNGISPNGDGLNDFWIISNIQVLGADNRVLLFNRWGDKVYEAENYNNTTVRFEGIGNNGSQLPGGTYYYKIEYQGETVTGYLSIRY